VLKASPPPAPSAAITSVPSPQAFVRDGTSAEPSLFIAIPIICYALREGLIEKEGLIFGRKEGYNNSGWKKPLDILNDKDQEGLKSISKAIGKKQILSFLKKEGITHIEESTTEDIILGKGYVVEKKKLLDLYNKYVSADYQKIFPFFLDTVGIVKNGNSFEFVRPKAASRERHEHVEEEWLMPNLTNLTIRDAIEKLSGRTAKIKVYGSGTVTDQQPKPFQRASGEAECVIYGRAGR
jgi:hypothetical protein